MKNLLFAATIMSSLLMMGFTKRSVQSPKPAAEYVSAVLVTQTEFDTLTAAFARDFPSYTQGGMINKDSLRAILDAMPKDSNLVNFVFGTDTAFNKTSLLIRGCAHQDTTIPMKCLRNGNMEEAFCPAFCAISNSFYNTTIPLDHTIYLEYYNNYRLNNPRMTFGGNIDRDALMEIINSIPSDNPNLFFRFCNDERYGKWSVIFIGGDVNNSILYYRNGMNENSFCPNVCDN